MTTVDYGIIVTATTTIITLSSVSSSLSPLISPSLQPAFLTPTRIQQRHKRRYHTRHSKRYRSVLLNPTSLRGGGGGGDDNDDSSYQVPTDVSSLLSETVEEDHGDDIIRSFERQLELIRKEIEVEASNEMDTLRCEIDEGRRRRRVVQDVEDGGGDWTGERMAQQWPEGSDEGQNFVVGDTDEEEEQVLDRLTSAMGVHDNDGGLMGGKSGYDDDYGKNVAAGVCGNQSDHMERDDDGNGSAEAEAEAEAEPELHGMRSKDDEIDLGGGTDNVAVPPPDEKIVDGEAGIRDATIDDQVDSDIVATDLPHSGIGLSLETKMTVPSEKHILTTTDKKKKGANSRPQSTMNGEKKKKKKKKKKSYSSKTLDQHRRNLPLPTKDTSAVDCYNVDEIIADQEKHDNNMEGHENYSDGRMLAVLRSVIPIIFVVMIIVLSNVAFGFLSALF